MSQVISGVEQDPLIANTGESSSPSRIPKSSSDEEYEDVLTYDPELEGVLQAAESRAEASRAVESSSRSPHQGKSAEAPLDMEDLSMVFGSRFEQFRRKGWLSVSDLVGTVWCEVQYDYRLRTLPFLPTAQRPGIIRSDKGKDIVVDKIKVEGKEKILRRGEKIHKRLEREIHPQEIVVTASSREDVWGLRFLNMLSALEALLTLGKCRELPVVGFVKGVLVIGVIDELTRKPLDPSTDQKPETRSSRQTSLTSFFSQKQPGAVPSRPRTHRIFVSDSKTRASGELPKEADTLAGRLQCMVYKELLDAMLTADVEEERRASERSSDGEESIVLPSAIGFTFAQVFRHLSLNPLAPFSDSFMAQSKPVVVGNTLRWGAGEARCLDDMVAVWSRYVGALGLGSPSAAQPRASQATNDCKGRAMDLDPGRSESRLELVYRRAGAKDTKKSFETAQGRRKKRRKRADDGHGSEAGADCTTKAVEDDDRLLKVAISESLQDFATEDQLESDDPSQAARLEPQRIKYSIERASEEERQEDELASAVEMSIVGPDPGAVDEIEVVLPLSRQSQGRPEQDKPILAPGPGHRSYVDGKRSTLPSTSPTPSPDKSMASGTIIGRHRFQHNPVLLEAHLNSVLQFWMGEREPEGVKLEQTNRCGWCEFEEGCEWRAQKAKETWDRVKKERDSSNVKLRRGSNLHREA